MAQLFLIAPDDAEPAAFLPALEAALQAARVDALLLPRGDRAEGGYKAFVKAVAPPAQAAGAAVLVEGEPGLVRLLGADGLHVMGGVGAVKAAVEALKPDFIVGAADIGSRHDAMSKAELGVDYVFFDSRPGQPELAQWWAETMEVPAVLVEPPPAVPVEFAAYGEAVWQAADGPAAALARLAAVLEPMT
jgi:thiamine-phosphate pyrophosphorylase